MVEDTGTSFSHGATSNDPACWVSYSKKLIDSMHGHYIGEMFPSKPIHLHPRPRAYNHTLNPEP